MGDDDRRVMPKRLLVGSGMGTTPERIDELRARARELDKQTQKPPARAFSGVLSDQAVAAPPQKTKKQQKHEALPRRGPRTKLGTPAQRAVVGQDEEDDLVVIKG